MSKRQTYRVEITIDVYDAEELRKAAEVRYMEDNTDIQDWRTMRADTGGEEVAADLQMLFDPGMSPNGTTIHESNVEFVGEGD